MSSTPVSVRRPDSLWLLIIAPAIWAVHLLASYISAAVWCAKFVPPGAPLGGIRTAIIWYTAVALAAIAAVGWDGLRRHRYSAATLQATSTTVPGTSTEATAHDLDTPEDQHRFIGFATLLLAGLSAVAVLYAALASSFFETCR